ncbi:telomerase reverse transcriptase isoform X4 [Helianthus annuus]|uniref:telomerase reverse transcriptase isoform X4 n=1 Tax=Helianthus annuus TaxID=4232 RepID=UPI000B909CF6|nr:telomerase reverse transcriptase isoform X4 [Helianthus annuus]
MRKVRKRVPEVLWKLFGKRAQSLAEALLSLIPPATLQCRCKGSRACLRCRSSDTERMSFLLREDDPSHYRTLLNHCFVVLFHTAPSPPPFDYHSRFSQIELVRKTIEMILSENISTKNVICTGYNKHKRSSTALEALTSSSWNLLLKRVGDGLMVHLLKHSLIFMPLNRKKHHQVAGIAINDLCWQHLKNHQHSSGVPERHHKADSVFMNIDIPESSLSCHGDSTVRVDLSQENGVLSRKRLRSRACRRKRKRRKLSSQYTKSSLPEKCMLYNPQMKSLCSCCSVWQTLQKVSTKNQINKRPMLYKLERTSSILPEKHIINSLRPNACGANALFKDIFDVCSALQPTQCTHSNDTCVVGATCLYHSLHKRLKILIRKASHCPRVKLLNKHILDQSSTSEQSSELSCSKRQVVSFVWAACMNIIPRELLGNWRILRKNISKFIRLRIYEKFSLHQCMYKLKISDFQFLSAICNSGIIRKLLERWTYWVFAFIVVPLLQANFYVTESEHGKLQVFFYEKSVWEKLMKTSIGCLKDECYRLVNVTSVKQIVSCRRFGFSRVRFRPKANGIRPLANLKSSSRLQISHSIKEFKAVNVVLQDLHAALKDVQIKAPEKLGSSVFSYNDVHRNLRNFISRVKSGSSTLPRMYMVVADVQKAYDSIDQDKLLHLMKDVIVDDHLLHQTHQIIASNQHFQVLPYINLCKQFRSHAQSHSSHSIILDQGRSRIAAKDDLHFNLQQHVKNNLLYIDQRFYQQNVGIPQGSILSSLLCSFYFGHMETTKLVPFLDKITKSDFMLLRFIDDFLFISTSKKLALGFFSRLERGFCEYNCSMNKEKFGLSFDFGQIKSKLNWSDFDGNGNKFVRWSGLLINCKTLEVQADYTRYLNAHLRSTLTVCWQGNPGQHFRKKMCDYLRPKCHPIFYDSNINSAAVVRLNIHQAFLLCAMKFHCYACDLSDICTFDSRSYLDIICKSLRYMYRLMKRRVFSMQVDPGLRPFIRVRRREVDWLGLTAYVEVLKRKQSRYNELLYLLELKLKSVTIESPDLKSAADKSNSSVLWKIKY